MADDGSYNEDWLNLITLDLKSSSGAASREDHQMDPEGIIMFNKWSCGRGNVQQVGNVSVQLW